MVLQNQQQQQTTVTTRTQQAPATTGLSGAPGAQLINKEAIVTNVTEKPILSNVIERKHVEVHNKPVVKEVHEQKIIEIQKQPVLQRVEQPALINQQQAATRYEELGSSQLGEQERLRLQQLQSVQAPRVVQEQGTIQQFKEREVLAQVEKQEFIERHVQPVITEVREQNVIQEVIQPVVRKIYDAPIVREVSSTVGIQQSLQQTHISQQQPLLQQNLQQQNFNRGGVTESTTNINQQGNFGTTKTTTTGSGMMGTTTIGGGPQQNVARHEQKVFNNEAPLNTTERQNLAVHEQAVNQVSTGQQLSQNTTGGAFNNTGATTEGDKPGFFNRVKGKLHLGHNNNDQQL
jgi:protein-disulfide isomerase-like protein with CxxC motif